MQLLKGFRALLLLFECSHEMEKPIICLMVLEQASLLERYGSPFIRGLQTGYTLNDNICGQGILALKVCADSASQFGMFLSCVFLLRAHSPQVVENRSSLQGIGSNRVH